MRHQEFLAGVATRGGFDNDDARHAADAVLATLARHLPADDRDALARALPNLLETESGVDSAPAADGGDTPTDAALVEDVARRSGWSPERSRYALTAVVGQLTAEDDDLGARLAKTVPEDLQGSTATLPPDAMSEGQQGRPQPLTAEELPRELGRLVGWSGDLTGIERTIELPSERLDLVLDRIHRAESSIGHRMHIAERTPTLLTLRASTDSLHAVTHTDITLAIEVDDAVSAVGSGG